MPRAHRIQVADGIYHVTVRGTEGRSMFLDNLDRHYNLHLIAEVVEELDWRVFAFCQMTNHWHMAVQTPNPDIALGMHHINGLFANRFNVRHSHIGHLQQARYGASLILTESHLLVASRYIVLNPVRARMCRRPGTYRWSSYRATAGLQPPPAWLDVASVLSWFEGRTERARRAEYVDFVASAIEPDAPPRDVSWGLAPGPARNGRPSPEASPRGTSPARAP